MRLASSATKFTVSIPESALTDLKARLTRVRWPVEPEGAAWEHGSNGAYMRRFINVWRDEFNWRQWEARLNRYEHYSAPLKRSDTGTEQVVHFMIERGSGDNPRPLLLTHGWPGSILEFIDVIGRLAHPERHGGSIEDAFTVICPSLPGYGFSMPLEKPISPRMIASLWRDLMVDVLGYPRFFAQAGDWGSIVSSWLGVDHHVHTAALHLNMVPLRPPILKDKQPLSTAEKEWIARAKRVHASEGGYQAIQSTKPTTLGYGLSDSPAGLAGWFVEKFQGFPRGPIEHGPPFHMDHVIANVALYWLTDTATTSTWLYGAAARSGDLALKPDEFVKSPTGFLLPPWDLVPPPPLGWLERGYNVVHRRDLNTGGHFVAMEQPDIFVEDVQQFFRGRRL